MPAVNHAPHNQLVENRAGTKELKIEAQGIKWKTKKDRSEPIGMM